MALEGLLATESTGKIDRLAWAILLLFFALFCIICIASTLGVYYFFFESTVPIQVEMRVGRGTVTVTGADLIGRAVQNSRNLTNQPALLQPDSQSQANLSFMDSRSGSLLASVTLKNDTIARLRDASSPRFDWSNGRSFIDIRDFSGELDILVVDNVPGSFFLQVLTTHKIRIEITSAGRYLIEASDSRVRVANREGRAALFSPDPQINRLISDGEQAELNVESNEIILGEAPLNLVENGLFARFDTLSGQGGGTILLPARWGCRSDAEGPPEGSFNVQAFDGRSALRLVRNDASTHGETRCSQPFTETGVDVSSYNFLELVGSFYINYQSLSVCGIAGSECPLMLVIKYQTANGAREWLQGFYYAVNPLQEAPTRCISCSVGIQEHQKINEKVWFTFETGNLLLNLLERPIRIDSIEFYASGHQYDVFISEIALLTKTEPASTESSGDGS